jgi:hypothetical protein
MGMSMTISIPTELEQKIAERAASRGLPLEEYVREVLRRDAEAPSLDEILAPVREQFAASGMTEEELDALVEKERQAIWDEKQKKKA